jgi:predicted Zn-dependent peptidase
LTQALGNNLMYYGRRVCTKELAERVASITNEQIQKVADKIVKNQDVLVNLFQENARMLMGQHQESTLFAKEMTMPSYVKLYIYLFLI